MNPHSNRSSAALAIEVCGLLMALMVVAPSQLAADERDCNRSGARYNTAINDVQYALGSFSSCVASSRGINDCSKQFDRLKSADSDFEDAVSSYQSDCKVK